MLLQSLPSIVQNPLIPLLILFGAGLGVGVAASLLGALGSADGPTADGRDDPTVADAADSRWDDGRFDE